MKKIVKDSENNLMELISLNGLIPDGYTEVSEEEVEAAQLQIAKQRKMSAIRSTRDQRLVENDKQWLIASKKGESTTAIETEAQALRDLPEAAELALSELETVEDILAYDPFEE